MIAFFAADSTFSRSTWVRSLNSLKPYRLEGTKSVRRHFWSPDSRHIAFVDGDELKKVAVDGGPVQTIAHVPGAQGGSWGNSDTILLDGTFGSLYQVSLEDRTVSQATQLDTAGGETLHCWPQFLPDGHRFLFHVERGTDYDSSTTVLKLGELGSTDAKTLCTVGSRVEYSPQGLIAYVQDGILMARRCDLSVGELTGDPVPLGDNIRVIGSDAQLSVSCEGTLVYERDEIHPLSRLVWINRAGIELAGVGTPGLYGDVALSRDAGKVAYTVFDPRANSFDVWVHDLDRDVSSRVTFGAGSEIGPHWLADEQRILYTDLMPDGGRIMAVTADGTGSTEQLLAVPDGWVYLDDIASNDRTLCVSFSRGGSNRIDLALWDRLAGGDLVPVCTTSFLEVDGALSPNRRFIAYLRRGESASDDIYVLQLDGSGGRWQISSGGGFIPKWRSDGSELFYWSANGRLMVVPVSTEGEFEAGRPQPLFRRNLMNRSAKPWDVAPDGRRFLLNVAVSDRDEPGFVVVENWEKLVPPH
jgi:hypothetical protein